VGRRHPSGRSLALLRIADKDGGAGGELVRPESEDTGKPFQLPVDEEIRPAIDQIRFFAGAARMLSGLSTGEYLAGHTSMIRREPIGSAPRSPRELPVHDGRVEVGPGERSRQRGRVQAERHHPR
jgi:betaine-aldehyde dehydrogenase